MSAVAASFLLEGHMKNKQCSKIGIFYDVQLSRV